jgi:hypothetical protein
MRSARWYLRTDVITVTLFIFFIFCFPGVLRAQDLPATLQSLPSSTSLTGTDLTTKCLECHKYEENHHPFNIIPSRPVNYPFPLYDGKIVCLTCHIEDHLGSVNLLRKGPYVDRRAFCFKCHADENYAKIDPHIMLDARGNDLSAGERPVCLFCHSVKPNPATDRSENILFTADVAFLCWRCHPPMAKAEFFEEHFLVTPTMEMRRFMEKQEQQLQITLPLAPRDRITCSTCHNPHQKDVILYGPSSSGADTLHRLRLPSNKICLFCHDINVDISVNRALFNPKYAEECNVFIQERHNGLLK